MRPPPNALDSSLAIFNSRIVHTTEVKMGRYTSVQTCGLTSSSITFHTPACTIGILLTLLWSFDASIHAVADNNAKVAPIPYDVASGGVKASTDKSAGAIRVPKVLNTTGSTAGAGSGEFHMYRKARREEMDRIANMEKNHREMIADTEFRTRVEQHRIEEEERTRKKAEKRRKQKERERAKRQKRSGSADGSADESGDVEDDSGSDLEHKPAHDSSSSSSASPLKANAGTPASNGVTASEHSAVNQSSSTGSGGITADATAGAPVAADEADALANDGSFLQRFLAAQNKKAES